MTNSPNKPPQMLRRPIGGSIIQIDYADEGEGSGSADPAVAMLVFLARAAGAERVAADALRIGRLPRAVAAGHRRLQALRLRLWGRRHRRLLDRLRLPDLDMRQQLRDLLVEPRHHLLEHVER